MFPNSFFTADFYTHTLPFKSLHNEKYTNCKSSASVHAQFVPHFFHMCPPHSSSCSLQSAGCLPGSPSLPPVMRWCPGAVLTWPVWRLALQCLLLSGWVVKCSCPRKTTSLLAATSWSSQTSTSLRTTRVWPCLTWASSRPQLRWSSKVRNRTGGFLQTDFNMGRLIEILQQSSERTDTLTGTEIFFSNNFPTLIVISMTTLSGTTNFWL